MSDEASFYIGEGGQNVWETETSKERESVPSSEGSIYSRPRKYKCPNCGGEFDKWADSNISKKECPFCATKKGGYGGEGDDE